MFLYGPIRSSLLNDHRFFVRPDNHLLGLGLLSLLADTLYGGKNNIKARSKKNFEELKGLIFCNSLTKVLIVVLATRGCIHTLGAH